MSEHNSSSNHARRQFLGMASTLAGGAAISGLALAQSHAAMPASMPGMDHSQHAMPPIAPPPATPAPPPSPTPI